VSDSGSPEFGHIFSVASPVASSEGSASELKQEV